MNRIEEINERLAAIETETANATGDALQALEEEVDALIDERTTLEGEVQRRQQMRSRIAAGMTGRVLERGGENGDNHSTSETEYRAAWLADLQGRQLTAEQRAAVSASGTIPTQTMNRIISALERSPLLSAVSLTYIPGNVSYPVEGTVNAANWVAMGTAATDGADTITTVTLGAYKLIKTVEISADVAAMSIDAFEDWLVERLSNKLMLAADAGICTGTGSNQATGILKSGEITQTGTYTKTKMTYADLMSIIATIPTQYLPNASFLMPRALFYGKVLGLTDTTGNRVVVADAQAPAKFNILGYPVIVDDNVTAGTIIFGDLRQGYAFNFGAGPEVKRDDSVGFRTGSSVYRAMALCDGKPLDKKALCVFTEAAS
jgi:HK97 family phage major capsid protein